MPRVLALPGRPSSQSAASAPHASLPPSPPPVDAPANALLPLPAGDGYLHGGVGREASRAAASHRRASTARPRCDTDRPQLGRPRPDRRRPWRRRAAVATTATQSRCQARRPGSRGHRNATVTDGPRWLRLEARSMASRPARPSSVAPAPGQAAQSGRHGQPAGATMPMASQRKPYLVVRRGGVGPLLERIGERPVHGASSNRGTSAATASRSGHGRPDRASRPSTHSQRDQFCGHRLGMPDGPPANVDNVLHRDWAPSQRQRCQ